MHNLLDTVALTADLSDAGLRKGDVGTVAFILAADAYEVEFVAASGRTQAMVTVTGREVRALGDQDLIAVPSLADLDA